MTDETRIDATEMRTAVGTCIKDPNLQNLFKSAPDGAREVIKLSFYSTVFPEKMDAHRFDACLRAVEPDLTPADLRYLIRIEDDPGMKNRFAKLLSERESGKAGGTVAEDDRQGASSARKFHVRRAEGSRPAVDLNAEAVKRNLELNELERREDEAREAENRKQVRRSALLKTGVSALVGLVVLAGGAIWLNARCKRQREQTAVAREAAERTRAKEMAEQEERERLRAEQQERQKTERAAEQAKRAAEQAKREAEAAERKRKSEDESRKLDEIAKRFDGICAAFDGGCLLPWSALPKAQKPGAVEGTFLCLVPAGQGSRDYYEVKSHTNGTMTVAQLSRGRESVDVSLDEWNMRLETYGGLVHDGRSCYLFLPKQTAGESPCQHEDIKPSQLRLGELAVLIRRGNMNTEKIVFNVRVRVPGVMNVTTIGEAKFDEYLGFDQIRRKIRDVAATKVKKQKPKPVRRTIVLYDGSITKRQINGVTLLPKKPTRITDQYMTMLAEAERQEQECEAMKREVEERYIEQVNKKTDDMLNSALISIGVSSQAR